VLYQIIIRDPEHAFVTVPFFTTKIYAVFLLWAFQLLNLWDNFKKLYMNTIQLETTLTYVTSVMGIFCRMSYNSTAMRNFSVAVGVMKMNNKLLKTSFWNFVRRYIVNICTHYVWNIIHKSKLTNIPMIRYFEATYNKLCKITLKILIEKTMRVYRRSYKNWDLGWNAALLNIVVSLNYKKSIRITAKIFEI